VQGNPGAPFLGIGQTGLAGPPGATGLQGGAGSITFPGNPYGVIIGNANGFGVASSNITYSNSKLNVNGNMNVQQIAWKSPFGVPQTGSASGTNSAAPLPSTPLISLSLNIVNASTGLSLMDYPAVFCTANMGIRNTLTGGVGINSTSFYMNNVFVGTMTQFPTAAVNPAVKLYQTRQFFQVLYSGVDYSAGGVSNIQFTCSRQVTANKDSSSTALGEWNVYMTMFGVF
jgi:hypothetical protein